MSEGLLAVCFKIEKKNLASVALGSLVGVSGAMLSTIISPKLDSFDLKETHTKVILQEKSL